MHHNAGRYLGRVDRPAAIVLDIECERIRVGEGGDLLWSSVDALRLQHERRAMFDLEPPDRPLPPAHVRSIVQVLRVLGGAVEDWTLPRPKRQPARRQWRGRAR